MIRLIAQNRSRWARQELVARINSSMLELSEAEAIAYFSVQGQFLPLDSLHSSYNKLISHYRVTFCFTGLNRLSNADQLSSASPLTKYQ